MSNCYHCGADCGKKPVKFNNKEFCCNGCKTVYEILNANELTCYYDLEATPGTIPTEIQGKYNYLDNEEIIEKLVEFNDGETSVVELYIPSVHCSSCIWVLENLSKLNEGVTTSLVNFPKKTVRITFKNEITSLKSIVELMTSIGYEPYISLEDADSKKHKVDKTLIYQISIAAFAFGNIMLLSFPEYFQVDEFWLDKYKYVFRGLMLVMAIPVVFYSAKDYFISAYKGLKHGILNIDVPISIGIAVLFIRSTVEVLFDLGSGFFDSLSGLVFFLLLGKFFQQKTYNFLSFERDYKSYFPIAVTKILNNEEKNIQVKDIKKGDRLLIRNEELIPVDGILINGNAALDYSFVTGESIPVTKKSGDKLFAGGKQTAGAIEMEVINTISQSYLTQLWSNDVFNKSEDFTIKNLTDTISKYFTIAILSIALVAGVIWYFIDSSMAINVVTAVLIIACPCALALSSPFAFGNMLRIFGYKKFYLKNAETIENLSKISTIIFDKTGTITTNDNSKINYEGEILTSEELSHIKTVLRASNHPLSRSLYCFISIDSLEEKPTNFEEILGKGIVAQIKDASIKLGSASFLNIEAKSTNETAIHIEIDAIYKGSFVFHNSYREGTKRVFEELSKKYKLVILSGDNEGEKAYLEKILPKNTQFKFNQKPEDKLQFIKELQKNGEHVLMIGDGLNDAGALAQSNVGIAISEDVNVFSPACDAILDAKLFNKLPTFFELSKKTISVIKYSFIFSFLYNIIGLYFALTGQLTPVVAAILMPLSSISIVVFVTILTNWISKKL
ncbi:heavy metal translocating P-type ATPase metal-binding domain-containing protein [Lutibacter sp. TH_r2]|uniref:heavy metal translocating P-type ATPase n=1 Tax=Lutibacter sp. TH_r2 TaxID=3082083 RepID=UPI0029532966|nr:heavy metal translocating P-type ATPase metal-binding domain-containing protein [Lutibacter sp. TH_r2]MDV7188418.1 heavy metal translocating P-type ATPase metal-binding domain-containing protein [Lutibacter sp. TH_r2]